MLLAYVNEINAHISHTICLRLFQATRPYIPEQIDIFSFMTRVDETQPPLSSLITHLIHNGCCLRSTHHNKSAPSFNATHLVLNQHVCKVQGGGHLVYDTRFIMHDQVAGLWDCLWECAFIKKQPVNADPSEPPNARNNKNSSGWQVVSQRSSLRQSSSTSHPFLTKYTCHFLTAFDAWNEPSFKGSRYSQNTIWALMR